MSTTPESVPTTWSVADEDFFRAVAQVFAAGFLRGASALLESYDDQPGATPATTVATTDNPARTEPAASWPLAA